MAAGRSGRDGAPTGVGRIITKRASEKLPRAHLVMTFKRTVSLSTNDKGALQYRLESIAGEEQMETEAESRKRERRAVEMERDCLTAVLPENQISWEGRDREVRSWHKTALDQLVL